MIEEFFFWPFFVWSNLFSTLNMIYNTKLLVPGTRYPRYMYLYHNSRVYLYKRVYRDTYLRGTGTHVHMYTVNNSEII